MSYQVKKTLEVPYTDHEFELYIGGSHRSSGTTLTLKDGSTVTVKVKEIDKERSKNINVNVNIDVNHHILVFSHRISLYPVPVTALYKP